MRIAILDSDPNEQDLICQALEAAGYSCEPLCSVPHGNGAPQPGGAGIDLLVMDWRVPGQDSVAVLQSVRAAAPGFPVLLLAARSDEDAIAAALDSGASDYLVRPMRRGELLTRVRILLRRAYPERIDEKLQFGQYLFELRSGRLRIADCRIELTQKEFELALLFFRNLDRPLSRAYIQETVWPGVHGVASRTMDTHVSRVRNKLRLRPENGFRLLPVYSYGYRLELLNG